MGDGRSGWEGCTSFALHRTSTPMTGFRDMPLGFPGDRPTEGLKLDLMLLSCRLEMLSNL